MNYRKLEGILYNYPILLAEIKKLKAEIEYIENEYQGVTEIDTTEEKTSETYSISSTVENEVIAREKRLGNKRNKLAKKRLEQIKIENLLNLLKEDDRKIIEFWYFKNWKNNQIARELYISDSTCSIKRKDAMSQLLKLLKENELF